MASQGWISVHRNIYDNWIWNDTEQFDKRSAWIDLLLMANHEDKKVLIDGQLEIVKRAQRITSINKLAKRWKWSRKKVTNFLQTLEEDDMIILKKEQGKYTTITIVNYSFYQDNNSPKEQVRNKWGTSEEQVKHINNNDNNDLIMINNDDDIDSRVKKINSLIKNKSSSSQIKSFLNSYSLKELDLLIEKIKESDYLKENINFNKLGKTFINKVFNDEYKTFKEPNKNTFKNFEQITGDYTEDELEEMALRKQKEAFARLGVEIWAKIYLEKNSQKKKSKT